MFAVSADGRLTQARSERQWAGGRATVGITAGKHYYEAAVRDDGLVRVVRLYLLFFFHRLFFPICSTFIQCWHRPHRGACTRPTGGTVP